MLSITTALHLTPKACLPLNLSIKQSGKQRYANVNAELCYTKNRRCPMLQKPLNSTSETRPPLVQSIKVLNGVGVEFK